MIITRTPLRISLVGGGTDIPEFFRNEFGAVVSFTIDKYITVCVSEKFDGRIRVSYSETENVDDVSELKHELVRETLKQLDIKGIEIVSVSDIPGKGTGLGSSSALLVGLLRALYAYKGMRTNVDPAYFAEVAYQIERIHCDHPVGKQDHYAAAYGGFHYYRFDPDGSVITVPIWKDSLMNSIIENSILLYTGKTRPANSILSSQSGQMQANMETGIKMRNLADSLFDDLSNGNWSVLGKYLHENWMLKKRLADGISDIWLDEVYDRALSAGAEGGKLLGAGGGGFFFFVAPPDRHNAIVEATGLRRVDFGYAPHGSEMMERW